jgi:hypothetical protein
MDNGPEIEGAFRELLDSTNKNFSIQQTSQWSSRARSLHYLRKFNEDLQRETGVVAVPCSLGIFCRQSINQLSNWMYTILHATWSPASITLQFIGSHFYD